MTPVVAQKAAALGCSYAKSEPAPGTCSRRGVWNTAKVPHSENHVRTRQDLVGGLEHEFYDFPFSWE